MVQDSKVNSKGIFADIRKAAFFYNINGVCKSSMQNMYQGNR
jgi:hypothetical protein